MKNNNKDLENVKISDAEINEINDMLKEKFKLYFNTAEVAVLKKIATPALYSVLKNVSCIKFTKKGELSIDSLYVMLRTVEQNLSKAKIKNPFAFLTLIEKGVIIFCIKVEETDDLNDPEKLEALNSIMGTLKKLEVAENIKWKKIMPRAHAEMESQLAKYNKSKELTSDESKGKKPRKKVPEKLRAQLQQEVNSKCPFCDNDDVGHFEVHHIDEEPDNNVLENLLFVCPTCHSKITKGDISAEEVRVKKASLTMGNSKVEIYNITIGKECSWEAIPNVKYGFELVESERSPYPILEIHFINHYNKTIVLKDVELAVKDLYSGLSGLPMPMEVPKGKIQQFIIDPSKEAQRLSNFNGIQIPSEQSYTLRLELMEKYDKEYFTLDTRKVLSFTLLFSNDITIKLPKVLLNTEDETAGEKTLILA